MWLFYAVGILLVLWLVDWVRRIPWVSGIHKKCVVITGCDSGFGNALARSLYRKGVYVFAGCFTDEGARKLTQETGERVKTFKLDVSKTSSIEQGYEFVKKNLPPGMVLWGLVNNAGISGNFGPCEFNTREDMLAVMNVNCMGLVEMVRVFLPLLKQSRGRIVNTASAAGLVANPGGVPYTASKFAVVGYSEALRHEKAVWGIKVSTICPGAFKTPILNLAPIKETMGEKWESLDPDLKAEYGQDFVERTYTNLQDIVASVAKEDLSLVVNAYQHGLFARWPRNIYLLGTDARVVMCLKNWAPWLMDYLMAKTWKKAMGKS